MKNFKEHLFILLVFSIKNSLCIIDAIYDAATGVSKLYSMINKISVHDTAAIEEMFIHRYANHQEIMNQTNEIHNQLKQIERLMYPKLIVDSLKLLPFEIMVEMGLESIEISVENIDTLYTQFYESINKNNYRSDMWHQLVENMLPQAEEKIIWMRTLVNETHKTLPDHQNIINVIADRSIPLQTQLCNGFQLIPNILVQLFKMIMISEIKANVMLAFAYLYEYSTNEGWKILNSLAAKTFAEYFASYVARFADNIGLTEALYIRACDPTDSHWIRNENFYELEETFQTAIFRYHWSQCKLASCNSVWSDNLDRCQSEDYDQRSACYHTTSNCIYLGAVKACALKSGPYKFQYLNSTELGPLGKNFTCPKDIGYMIEEETTGFISSYAACACDCHGNHNKISLSIVQSQVTSNKVITGLRFLRKNRILYIQPREGTLKANGYIPRSSQRWISIPDNQEKSEIHSIDDTNKVFFLDDLRLPSLHVLTGIKFNKVTRGAVTGFAIEIFGMPFDYNTGQLISSKEGQISKRASDIDAGMGLSFNAERSIDAAVLHSPNPPYIKYVSLRQSELSADFGQSTLPFFDAVPIVTDPPSVLGGFGIFHKGAAHYAGFISLRLFGIECKTNFVNFQSNHVVNERVIFNHS